ncbi:hypothetical protein [Helicobacter brantae]|uniref:Uncharacterized protein n=1 Tax=Helicobacter brantae TaxID=375927 RepID=A0A3D8IY51_9HELI|nr:hypothetical protein [Helicobacter brantae]RDU70197.1 hypothetical protein CQA58_06195 [Helicobacter brantae]
MSRYITTGLGSSLKFVNYFDKEVLDLYWGYKTSFSLNPQATISTKSNGDFLTTMAKPQTTPNPNASNLYERYANEELIFEWRDFNPHQAILEFLGIGGDYFSLTGCTYLKLKARLLYQIESYFWDMSMSDWSDELYQSYVIKPIEIMGIKSKFIESIKDEDIAYVLNLLDLQITQTPRLFEIYNVNLPTYVNEEVMGENFF